MQSNTESWNGVKLWSFLMKYIRLNESMMYDFDLHYATPASNSISESELITIYSKKSRRPWKCASSRNAGMFSPTYSIFDIGLIISLFSLSRHSFNGGSNKLLQD